eukprot:gb/GECH01012129.1/.p1 GENE.gb/GECH01012129.1/~~gb/GECH01012129.1/.p1  ORF type:complete len:744 (+),score=187.61 gb/GECH01012129.1/:1-2232(+)
MSSHLFNNNDGLFNSNQAQRRLAVTMKHISPELFDSSFSGKDNMDNTSSIVSDECRSEFQNLCISGSESFNVNEMYRLLNGDDLKWRDFAIKVIRQNSDVFYRKPNASKAEHRELVSQQIKRLGKLGIVDMRNYKRDYMKYRAILDVFGMFDHSLSIKIGVQFLLWGGSILNLGTKKHHDKYIDKISRLELPGCFCMTEMGHGSNVRAIKTTATYDKNTEEFIVNSMDDSATKFWIGNAAKDGIMGTVFCKLIIDGKDYGVHTVVVPLRDPDTKEALPGVEIGDCGEKVGLSGVDNGWIQFHNVRVPRENLLNRFAEVSADGTYSSELNTPGKRFAAVLGELVGGRVGIVLNSNTTLKMALTIAVRYAASRRQFGPPRQPEIPIMDFRSFQTTLMPMLASSYAGHFTVKMITEKYNQMINSATRDEDLLSEVHALSAGLKAMVSWNTQESLQKLREILGGYAYQAANRIGQMRDDHDIYQTFEGDNSVLMQQVAHSLLKEFREQFKNNQVRGLMAYMRRQAANVMATRNPVVSRLGNQKHLRNSEFQISAFEYRTARLLRAVAIKIARVQRRVKGQFQSWNECLPDLIELAKAYMEQVMVETFIERVEKVNDYELKHVLKMLSDLYALSLMVKDIGNFRNFEMFKSTKARAVKNQMYELCRELRPHAVSLVDSFGIPDDILGAPIGQSNNSYLDNTLKHMRGEEFINVPEQYDDDDDDDDNGNDEEAASKLPSFKNQDVIEYN